MLVKNDRGSYDKVLALLWRECKAFETHKYDRDDGEKHDRSALSQCLLGLFDSFSSLYNTRLLLFQCKEIF